MTKSVRILSIDGGGIRGIIPGLVLKHIEDETSKPIADHFHMIAGTSTGGILAAGLSKPSADGTPDKTAEDLVNLYRNKGDRIFESSLWRDVTSLGGLTEELYSHRNLERFLKEELRNDNGDDVLLSEAIVDLLVTSYEIEYRTPFFFKSWKADGRFLDSHKLDADGRAEPDKTETASYRDFPLWSVGRATSAAPTYFEPALIENLDGDEFACVDGGVFANNPAMCAYVSAKKIYDRDINVLMVSLGTGELERPIPYDSAKGWGKAQWAVPIISVLMDGAEDTAHYHVKDLLRGQDYFRFQVDLKKFPDGSEAPSDDMDDASADNIERLERKAGQLMDDNRDELDELLEILENAKEDLNGP